jgi:purine-nucleoside phosphorylase
MGSDSADAHPERAVVAEIVSALTARLGDAPPVAVVLGSGLGGLVHQLDAPQRAAYADVGLPQPAIVGHDGAVTVGTIAGVRVALLSGRVHAYEGRPLAEVVRGVRAMHAWGVRTVLLSASVGTILPDLAPGSLGLVRDYVNLQGRSPLVGPAYGTRFPDVSDVCAARVRATMRDAAAEIGLSLPEVVYAAMLGPAYESAAEIRMLRVIGCDVVGMSTVPELLAGAELGLEMGALAVVTNFATGVVPGDVDHAAVLARAAEAGERFGALIRRALPRIAAAA